MANKQKNKQQIKGRKAGWIAFGVTALLYAAIFPLYRIGDFILAAAVAFLVGKVVSIMGSGLDLTTHNPVSYTHLDVYKRQLRGMVTFTRVRHSLQPRSWAASPSLGSCLLSTV